MSKPSIPKGTRDFSPAEMAKRNYILDTIKKHFRLYGFEQIETPAMEQLTTLTGKYGEEGDQLLFKILNSRMHESREKDRLLEEFSKSLEGPRNSPVLTERALRYDLTVPFARYVVQHQHELAFPFKRFQIQPVWRADKPQKGRYREFYQCDADMIGSDSLVNEVELVQLMHEVYFELKLPVEIKFNNRKILSGIAELIGEKEKFTDIITALDKLDKIGDKIYEELTQKGFSENSIAKVRDFVKKSKEIEKISQKGKGKTALLELYKLFEGIEIGQKGVSEVATVFELLTNIYPGPSNVPNITLDLTLARGLNYYTGAIFEVKAAAGTFTPSITGGGRYDDLTGIFGLPNMSGVGISFGIDRIYDVMEELDLFPPEKLNMQSTQLLLMHMGEAELQHGLELLPVFRKAGIRTEIYPDVTKKMNKQFDYATKKNIPYALVIGSNEMSSRRYTLKTKDEKFPDLTTEEIVRKITA